MKTIAAIASAAFALTLALSAAPLQREDEGRLLAVRKNGVSRFYIYLETGRDGSLFCTRLGSSQSVKLSPRDVEILPFSRDVPADAVATYAIAQAGGLLGNGRNCIELAAYISCPRGERLRQAVADLDALALQLREEASRYLQAVRNRQETPVLEEEILSMIEESRPIAQIKAAIQEKDFFLAMALFENLCRTLAQFSGNTMLNRRIGEFIRLNREGMLREYQLQRGAASTLRNDLFRKLEPSVFGEWRGMPSDYAQLKRLFVQSFRSYCNLDVCSPNANFPEWGSSMLDVLAMIPDSPVAEPLGREFDRAFERYQKRRTHGAEKEP